MGQGGARGAARRRRDRAGRRRTSTTSLVDLSPFGLDNPGEVFHVTDRPYGLIEVDRASGTVTADGVPGAATLGRGAGRTAEHPDAVPIAGGTDVMVELNFDRRRPPALLDLTRVAELRDVGARRGRRRPARRRRHLHAGSSTSSATGCPAWRWPRAPSGSPQIRNRGTVGGNLGAASPAGDAHPRAAGRRRRGRAGVGPRACAGCPVARLLHRGQAQRARPGRADPRRAGHGRAAGPQQFARSAPATRW